MTSSSWAESLSCPCQCRGSRFSVLKTSTSQNHAYRVLHSRFPPFGFVLKPLWSIHMCFNIVMADSCQKSFFKTSISRNHAYRVLHSRFPPFGFVLKPFRSMHMILRQLWQTSCRPRPWMTADLHLAGLTQIPFEKKQFWSQKSILKGVPLSGQCPP